jgi:SfnB family sulfur acquisition oxidoreductase
VSVVTVTTDDQAVAVAREYAATLEEGAAERDRAGQVPWEALRGLDSSGLLAITVPRDWGGAGISASSLAEVVRVIASVDPAIAQIPQGHWLLIDVLSVWGSAEAQDRIFSEIRGGRRLAAALSERGGRHAQDLQTRLHRHPGGLQLNGRKYYSTGALTAGWIGVSALDGDGQLALAFVESGSEGLTRDADWDVMGQRATVSGSTTFEQVAVDPALVIPYQRAFETPQQFGARAQLVHAAIQVGIAGGALRDGRDFVRTRARPFFEAARAGWAGSAAEDPYTLSRYGRLATEVQAAEELLRWSARTLDEVGLRPADAGDAARGSLAVARAKAFASEVAVRVSSDLFSLAGASAADERHDLSRHWRNARTHASHDPVEWKYHHIGNFELNGTLPPNHGQL